MKHRDKTSRIRAGFSLMELLVVIAIIAVLAGMLFVAFVPSIGTSHRKNTNARLKALDGELAIQWSEAGKQFERVPVPPQIQSIFGCIDERTAKAIWVKLQRKAAFPMTYAEALDPAAGNTALQAVLKPRPVFVSGLKGKTAAIDPATEGAACLLLALQQNFGGKKFDAEAALGAGALKDTDGDGLTEIVDSWGKPLFFIRWGTGNPDLAALSRGANNNLDRDTEDTGRFLMLPSWNPDNAATPPGVAEFQRLCHPVRAGNSRQSYFTIPTVVSAGKDGNIGLNWDMSIQSADAEDNLYSFKTR